MNTWSRDAVADVLGSITRNLTDEALAIAPDFNPETIHKFRVETKRLRAVLRLVEAQDESAAFKLSKSFRKLYRYSGAVRDAQVLLARATTACDPPLPDYTVWLAQQMADAQIEYTAFFSRKILKKLEKDLGALDIPEITVETLQRFFRERLEETKTLLQHEPLEDEDLHTVRKRVKDLQHVAKVCSEAWPEGMEALGDMASLDALDELTTLAGDYNDQAVAVASLEQYLDVAEKPKKTAKVHAKWTEQKEADREKLLDAITAFREAAMKAGGKKKAAGSKTTGSAE